MLYEVITIRCQENDRLYVAASGNLDSERNSRLFQLRMGKVVFSRELQHDLERFGAAAFTFEVLATLEPATEATDVERQLAILELQWLEQLQPFEERGYNSRKRFERCLV